MRIAHNVAMTTIAPEVGMTLPMTMVYDTDEPYAITLNFGADSPVTWMIGLDLISDGIMDSAGDGDVVIARIDTEVYMTLKSPDQPMCVLTCGYESLSRFVITAKELSVPHTIAADGTIPAQRNVDIDAELQAILSGGH